MTNTTINIDEIKKRLDALKKGNKKSNLLWKPTPKEQTIRIVPYKYSPDYPFVELYFHYDLAGKTYISPVSFNKPDPIMEVANQLKSTGNKEDWQHGKKLEPKLRTFAPVIVRGKEHEGVKFWGFGKTIYEELLGFISDEDYGDITNVITGRDITVYTEAEAGKSFASPKMRIKPSQTKVTEDMDILKKIAKDQPDIKELWELKSYEELEIALAKHLDPEKEEDAPNAEPNTTAQSAPDAPAAPVAETTQPSTENKVAPVSDEDFEAKFASVFAEEK